MTYGTSYFKDRAAAIRYYRPYGYDDVRATVARKIREGEIHIGRPPLKAGERAVLVDGRTRYAIESANPSKRATERRVSKALKKFLATQNPGRKYAGATIQKLKGGAIKIVPVKAK